MSREGIAFPPGEPPAVGVALSGGADSVALLLIGTELGWRITALHCNFQLRGAESERDMAFVTDLCDRLGIPLQTVRFDVAERMKSSGESVEMACRSLRYGWFEEKARELRLDAIALGHHSDDNIETFLLNAIRGSGIGGVKGIMPRRGLYIRPLLELSREELGLYLESRGESHITDSTNLESEFRRNRLRNKVIPGLHDSFPDARRGLTSTLDHLRDDFALFDRLIVEKRAAYASPEGGIDIRRLVGSEDQPAPMLFHLLEGRIDRATAARVIASAGESGRYFEGKNSVRYLLDRGILRPAAANLPDTADSSGPLSPTPAIGGITLRELTPGEFRPRRDPAYAWFDASLLDDAPGFRLRQPRAGDRMLPFGMKGSRLLSDIFTDLKIPADRRPGLKVLTRNDEILWIPGVRASALFPVSSATSNIIELHWEITE